MPDCPECKYIHGHAEGCTWEARHPTVAILPAAENTQPPNVEAAYKEFCEKVTPGDNLVEAIRRRAFIAGYLAGYGKAKND